MSINTFNKTEGTLIPVSTGVGVIAEDVEYNDIQTQFGSTNVQDAIVALAANSGGSPYTYMTQAEYEVLETPDPDTMYWVTYPLSGDHIVWRNGEAVDSKVCENGGFAFPPAPQDATYHCYPYSHIAIPSFSGMTTIALGRSPFKYAKYVDIAKGVTNLSPYIFQGCSGLTSVTIPNSVTTIGGLAFYDCTGLTTVTIPNSVTTIGSSAFNGCSGLTSITIPDSVTTIGENAFQRCTALTSITLPSSVTSIGNYAFDSCTALTTVTISSNVTTISDYAFKGCSGLTSVTIPNSVTTIGYGAFYDCTGLTTVTISNGVTTIGSQMFQGCSGLTSVTIPNSVTTIGGLAFYDCTALTDFGFRGTRAQWGSVSLGNGWKDSAPFTVVHCTDGDSTRLS